VGFVSKWALVSAALEQQSLGLAFLIMASSLIAVVYVWRVVEIVYFGEPVVPDGEPKGGEAPLRLLVPSWILAGASIYFGLFSDFAVEVSELAARQLLSAGG
jgi:multicomponent Na+:H+ antiporter subunit D